LGGGGGGGGGGHGPPTHVKQSVLWYGHNNIHVPNKNHNTNNQP